LTTAGIEPMPSKKKQSLLGTLPKLHTFFLNPYADVRFSSCPQCGGKTKIRKKPFLIHINPNQLLVLNMSGPYCPACDLMILHQDKLEALMVAAFEQRRPEILGNEYLVMGTMERQAWLQWGKEPLDPKATIANLHVFKKVVSFERPRWE